MTSALTGILAFLLLLLIYAFIWLLRKRRSPAALASGAAGGASSLPSISRELTGLRLGADQGHFIQDPEWREWDAEEKSTFGPCLEGERVFSNAGGDARVSTLDGKVYRILTASPASEVDALRGRFTGLYGAPTRPRAGWETWEDGSTRLELNLRGPEVKVILTDKRQARSAIGATVETPARRRPHPLGALLGFDTFGRAGFGGEGRLSGLVEITGRVLCAVVTVLSYQICWWAPLVVAPLFHQVYEWPFISMKIDWQIHNRWVKFTANALAWVFYFAYIGLAILLFSLNIDGWYGWLVGVGVGIVVTRFLGFLFPVRWRYERGTP